jgi:NAD(P)-dependent dehydrogenase (short-subunit alcohol dehydrogenase family)
MSSTDTSRPSLEGLQAVITGAAGGIGRAIVRSLLDRGTTVQGLDRDRAALEALAEELGPAERFHALTVDLASPRDTDRVLARLSQRLGGRADILVNNAGVSRLRAFADTDDELLEQLLAVNLIAAFRLTRALLPALRASGRAAVINIASELALVGQAGYSAYCATKGAMLGWTRALAVELAPCGIRVNALCPGPIDTAMLQAEFAALGDPVRARADEIATVPLGRLGAPHDIAAVVAFLASDAASFVSGAAWPVDGGKTAR